ncbi:AraC family transcriptional regulator [Phytobacter diazotrophicus]|uniref:AraC family transcriptional regulator n=1 Tax=Phytobacter diazotrophicus TaxID=395631 RepID=UPI002FF6D710
MIIPACDQQGEMISLIKHLAPFEGHTNTLLDGVRLMRADRPLGKTPVLYEPSIVIVCQGSKRGFLGERVYHYDAQHYLVLSVPLPFSTETFASQEKPLLAISIRLDMMDIADLMLEVEHQGGDLVGEPLGIISTPLDSTLADTALRLLRALTSPLEAKILGQGIVRELFFRVLRGEQGPSIRAALACHGSFGQIACALKRIHSDYSLSLDVGLLAREARMGIPTFHAHFKAVTGTSPIQYVKSVRLHQARLLMIRDNLTAAAAALRVGYESPSQFNREFKRTFGRSPAREVREMKTAFALSPAVKLESIASTH